MSLFSKKAKEIYMDYASSTPLDSRVQKTMDAFYTEHYANPSALHKKGVAARRAIDEARKKIAHILHAHANEIIFTSGGTESDNLAIMGVVIDWKEKNHGKQPHIITTAIEHSAVLNTCRALEKYGVEVTYVPVEANGIVDLKELKKALRENTILVSVMHVNNEIGTIQPIAEIAKLVRHVRKESNGKYPLFHTDAAQAVQYCLINTEKLGVDLMSFNGSKIYGPKGIGVLFKKRAVELSPQLYGGSQEFGLRAGTENGALIVGLAEALQISEEMKEKEGNRLTFLRDYFISELYTTFEKIILNGDEKERVPNNVNISVANIPSELLLLELDARSIFVSSKSACKSDDPDESYVLKAIAPERIADDIEEGSIRFSLGRDTTKSDIDAVINALRNIFEKLNPWYNEEIKSN